MKTVTLEGFGEADGKWKCLGEAFNGYAMAEGVSRNVQRAVMDLEKIDGSKAQAETDSQKITRILALLEGSNQSTATLQSASVLIKQSKLLAYAARDFMDEYRRGEVSFSVLLRTEKQIEQVEFLTKEI